MGIKTLLAENSEVGRFKVGGGGRDLIYFNTVLEKKNNLIELGYMCTCVAMYIIK